MAVRMHSQKRATRRVDPKLLQSYANEAARLREHAAGTTTARIRARLLEEAASQERLAGEVNAGRTGLHPYMCRNSDRNYSA
jgi:hypothetical protein